MGGTSAMSIVYTNPSMSTSESKFTSLFEEAKIYKQDKSAAGATYITKSL